jgi:hypothetical protein
MTLKEMKKQLTKDIITPFFINNGFRKKGNGYFKTINFLIFEAFIISRQYKINKNGEFKVYIKIYPDNSDGLSQFMLFGSYSIGFPKASWITITENTDIENIKIKVKENLNNFLEIMEKYNNADGKIIEEMNMEINELRNEINKLRNNDNGNIRRQIKTYEEKIELINNWIKKCNKK